MTLPAVPTVADGIAVSRPGDLTLAHVARLVDRVVTVPDEAVLRAVLFAVERARVVAEPAGAAGIAAVLQQTGMFEPPVVVVVSGANIDPAVLVRALRSGVAARAARAAWRAGEEYAPVAAGNPDDADGDIERPWRENCPRFTERFRKA